MSVRGAPVVASSASDDRRHRATTFVDFEPLDGDEGPAVRRGRSNGSSPRKGSVAGPAAAAVAGEGGSVDSRREGAGVTLIGVGASGASGRGARASDIGGRTRACCAQLRCRRARGRPAPPPQPAVDDVASATSPVAASGLPLEDNNEDNGGSAACSTQRALSALVFAGAVALAVAGAVASAEAGGAPSPALNAAWRWLVVVGAMPLSLALTGVVARGTLAAMEMPASPNVEAIYLARCAAGRRFDGL